MINFVEHLKEPVVSSIQNTTETILTIVMDFTDRLLHY